MKEPFGAIVALVTATVGIVVWYRAPYGNPSFELLLLGAWFAWVVIGTALGTMLTPYVRSRVISRSDVRQSLQSIDRRVVLTLILTALCAVFGGMLVAILV
jgi:hypothetical protein